MKNKSPQSAQAQSLKRLLSLVMRHAQARGPRKRALQTQISTANDRFYARWQRDGLALLVLESANDLVRNGK